MNIIRFGAASMLMFAAVSVTAASANIKEDAEIRDLIQQPQVLQAGKGLFEQICASCHAKDLSGGAGFNLKDGEWLHGSQPAEILNNVKNGFMNAGMPGFGAIFSEPQLKSIVAYVLSKREGFDGLSYKLYQMTDENDKVIAANKLVKQGIIANNLADYQIPEIEDYVIVFEGNFNVPFADGLNIWIPWGKSNDVTVEADGEIVPRIGEWDPIWQLKPGQQQLKIIYHSGSNKPQQRNIPLIATNLDKSIKLFPASTRAKEIMDDKKVEIKAVTKTIVQRKKIHSLPSYSVSVGLPAKINYAFNTRSCAIVGLWQGDMLNVGPNVSGRGQDGSLPLGDWIFKTPQVLSIVDGAIKPCGYKGYQESNEPIFKYQLDKHTYTLTAVANGSDSIRFDYQVDTQTPITFELPQAADLSWHSAQGKLQGDTLLITPDNNGKFSITAKIGK